MEKVAAKCNGHQFSKFDQYELNTCRAYYVLSFICYHHYSGAYVHSLWCIILLYFLAV